MAVARSFATTDVDEARHEVADLFCPHALEPSGGALDLTLRARRLAGIAIVDLDYGGRVRIDPGDLERFYLVQLPLAGAAEVRQGTEAVRSTPTLASVLSPGAHVRMEWHARTPQSIVYLDRSAVERRVSGLLGRTAPRLTFDLGMRMEQPGARAWQRAVAFVREEIEQGGDDTAFAAQAEELLIGRLLGAQRHTMSAALSEIRPAAGRAVRRACALMRDHHSETLTVADIAEAIGVSVRALQEGFRRDLQQTPMEFLREVRLDAAHQSLLASDGARDSVSTIALRHGFTHLGRFSVAYRQRYGRPPSEALAG